MASGGCDAPPNLIILIIFQKASPFDTAAPQLISDLMDFVLEGKQDA